MSEHLSGLINDALHLSKDEETSSELKVKLSQTDTNDTALLLESVPIDERVLLWEALANHKKVDVLVAMRDDARIALIEATELEEWEALFIDVEAEVVLELVDSLPKEVLSIAYSAMDRLQKLYFSSAIEYAAQEVGHWINHNFLVLPLNAKVRDGVRLLRRDLPAHTDAIYLINRAGGFSYAVPITKIFSSPEHIHLVDIALEDYPTIHANEACHVAAKQVLLSNYSALPVVSADNKLLGRIDSKTASELAFEYYERQLMAGAGMDEDEDLFSPVRKSAKGRAVWLGINLLTAFLASAFIGVFEATLQQVVALAVLMPIVASMGGIAGSQTLTLIIRGLALKQVTSGNAMALLIKELKVGGLNGIIWALVIGVIAALWFNMPLIGVVIACAILLNIIAAALAGVCIPIILDKLNIDPALSGSVILTTVTDIVGFVAFLGLGTWLLL
ncbi:magnesium transporter [Brumicola blandensis]|uniref:Magnesium transporter n=1 Tax=Brumicola blandensis TaxID=3075611 RepID=A0AAW8QXM4_9ALTE|nr:magnesium transporter [Alteromonas sp. W409]MDT0581514.1 magnesium transporter [Alteromonas sp. W409]